MRLIALLVMLAGCASPEPAVRDDPLSGTRWSLVSFGGSPVLASETTSMQFDKGRLTGSDGCNRYSTSYAASGNRLKIEPKMIGTRMACAQQVMEEAAAFTAMLGRAAGYRLDGDRLSLLESDGRPMAAFRKAP